MGDTCYNIGMSREKIIEKTVAEAGVEPPCGMAEKLTISMASDAKCDAVDAETVEIVQLWRRLSPEQRIEILQTMRRFVRKSDCGTSD